MAKSTPDFLFLTWEDLSNDSAFEKIQNFLNIKEVLKKDDNMFKIYSESDISETIITDAENCYEKYFYYLRELNEKNNTN